VATVVVSRDTATLVPRQALLLTAETRGAAGQVLTGRPTAWSSTAAAVATVSTDGLVTAVAAGSAAVIAVSEGKTGAMTVTVREGAVVAATGGLAATADSLVTITIPGGALVAAQAITIAPIAAPVAHPRLLAGSGFEFGPGTVTLAQAATIRIGYAGTTVPVTADPARFRLHRLVAGAWAEVTGSTVDLPSNAVSGPAAALGAYAIIELTPIPVATVALTPTADTLVPLQTLQLVATLRDAGGALLGLRPMDWTSSAPAVATVSSTGLVTAASVGQATLTAVTEGKSATATITVAAGAVIGAAGGVAATGDGKAQVTIPAGALAAALAITITPAVNPPASPLLVTGTAFDFAPSGAFAQPVTIRLSYAGTTVPAAATESLLRLHRLSSGAWVEVPGSAVDMVAKTVTGPTSSFSTYAVVSKVPPQQVTVTWEYQGAGGGCSTPAPCGMANGPSWIVPADVYSATVELWGASGGGPGGFGTGQGKGGKTSATIVVVPGELIQVRLGGIHHGTAAGGNGGGGGGAGASNGVLNQGAWCLTPHLSLFNCPYPGTGFAGGGATDIRRTGVMNPPAQGCHSIAIPAGSCSVFPGAPGRLAVAGGGGGDGGRSVFAPLNSTGTLVPGGHGGLGGGLAGGPGGNGPTGARQSSPGGGSGGTQVQPGVGGAGARDLDPNATYVTAGGDNGDPLWGGGRGGIENGTGGGGGGGGWYGGGGGGSTLYRYDGAAGGGGGGGSSWGPVGSSFFQGVHTGGGRVMITFTPSPGLTPSQIVVTASPNPAGVGQPVTFTATVGPKPPALGTVTGSVLFEVNGQQIGVGTQFLAGGQAVSLPLNTLGPGVHTIQASYLGSPTYAPSSATVQVTINP